MKKKISGLAIAGLLGLSLLAPPLAVGQHGEVEAKFYKFSNQVIDGKIKRPEELYTRGNRRATFGELYKLKIKSFIPTILETSKESVFH